MNSEEQAIREIHARTVGSRSGLTRDERHIGALIIALDAERERSRKLRDALLEARSQIRALCSNGDVPDSVNAVLEETKPGDANVHG